MSTNAVEKTASKFNSEFFARILKSMSDFLMTIERPGKIVKNLSEVS